MPNPSRTRRSTVRRGPSPVGPIPALGRWRSAVALVAGLALLVAVTGCAAPPPPPAASSATEVPVAEIPQPAPDTSAEMAPVAADHLAVIVRAEEELEVHDRPDGAVTHTLAPTTELGSRRTLLVATVPPVGDASPGTAAGATGAAPTEATAEAAARATSGSVAGATADGWVEVHLPVRPNGSTGFVRRDAVTFDVTDLAVEIDLDARELRVLRGGEELLVATTGIGDADHPTPTGTFFVTDKVATEDPDGPYGPYALGLSARSDVLTEFAGGDGQVGIHGTDAPASIGEAASKGCLRVSDQVVTELAHLLPLGTPVTIR